MLLPRASYSSAILVLHLPTMHMLSVEVPRDSAVIIKSLAPCPTFKTFELSSVTLKLLHSKLTIFNVYRRGGQENLTTVNFNLIEQLTATN